MQTNNFVDPWTWLQAAQAAEAATLVAEELAQKYFNAQKAEEEAVKALEAIKDSAPIAKQLTLDTSSKLVAQKLDDAKKAVKNVQALTVKAEVAAAAAQKAAEVSQVISPSH